MRCIGNGGMLFPQGTLLSSQKTAFAESDNQLDLEARIRLELSKIEALGSQWDVVFLNLAAGGYDAPFVFEMYFADASMTFVLGVPAGVVRVFTYGAATAEELPNARRLAMQRAARRLGTEEPPGSTYSLVQTALVGGSQGTPYMGALVFILDA